MGISRHGSADHEFVLTRRSGALSAPSLLEHVLALNREARETSGLRELAAVVQRYLSVAIH